MVETLALLLRSKGSAIHAVSPDATVYEAVSLMAAQRIGAVLVIEDGSLLGIMSAKDYGTRIILQGRNSKEVLARDVMTTPVLTVGPDENHGRHADYDHEEDSSSSHTRKRRTYWRGDARRLVARRTRRPGA